MQHGSHDSNDFENIRSQFAEAVRLAAGQIDQRHDGRAEQQRIDLVKVAAVALEDRSERLAEVARGAAWHLRSDLREPGVVIADPQRHFAAIEDRVVGAADADQVVRRHRRQRGSSQNR